MKRLKIILGTAALTAIVLTAPAQSFITNGLVSYYPFNGNANDSIGTNNGTVYGAVLSTNRFGQANSAYLFNGSSSYIDLGTPANLAFTNNFTLSAWCLFNGGPNNPRIICYTESYGYDFYTSGNGSCRPIGSQIGNVVFQTSPCFQQNVWHSVAMVVTNGYSTIYVDGTFAGVGPAGVPSIYTDLYIGRSTGIDYWGGLIDDVRFYKRALSSNEVAQLYTIESATIVITNNLTNTSVLISSNTSFTVSATSVFPLTYQWYFNPTNNSGQAGAYAQTVSGFVVGAVVTNGGFGYGNVPAVKFVGGGSGAAGYGITSNGILTGIIVTNAGSGYSTLPGVVIDPPNGLAYGQTNNTLNIANASSNNVGTYYVVISNGANSISSSVVLLNLLYPPSIVNQPQDVYADAYDNAVFNVTAGGTTPFTYDWQLNNSNVVNGSSSTLIVSNITPSNLGAYSVIVNNAYGSVTSSIANLYMYPYLAEPFAGVVTYWGQTNILSVGAWGSGNLSYQWYFNGVSIPDATGSTLVLDSIQFTNAGLYSVVVSSSLGSVTNTPEQVVVNAANISLKLCPDVVIQGTVGYSYIIQSTADLSNTNSWVTLTNLTLTQPIEYWDDISTDASSPNNPKKFYRVLSGQ
jgi:hypothetical protein